MPVDAFARCVTDFAYWAETCYRIRDKHGRIIPFALNETQHRIDAIEREELAKHGRARLFILKARQGGVTTHQQARNLHQIWSEPNFDVVTFNAVQDDTDKVFEITNRAIDHFPVELLPAPGEKATREVSFPEMDAIFWTATAGAKRSGRGLTLKRLHATEFALWDKPRTSLNRITPALVPNRSVVVLETTASGYDSEAHQFWREAMDGANGYRAVFFPWWECDAQNYRLPLMEPDELGALGDDETHLVQTYGLDLEQIKWRRQTKADMHSDFATEYAEDAETCWAAAGGMVYDAELLKRLLSAAPEPTDTDWAGALEIFAPHFGEPVVIGADTAEGVNQDSNTFTARTYPTRRLLATFADAGIEPEEFAGLLNTWGRRFASSDGLPAFLVIEKNMHGITVLRKLRDFYKYPTSRLYHRQTQDEATKQSSDKIGWHTGAETKGLLIDAGRDVLNAAGKGLMGIPSKAALRNAFAVRRDPKTGKIDLNGRDALVGEMLCEIGHHAYPSPRSWWLGPVEQGQHTPVGGK